MIAPRFLLAIGFTTGAGMGSGIWPPPRLTARRDDPVTPATEEQPFRFPEGHHGRSTLRSFKGVPLLTVQGTPEEIGEAIGILALRPGRRMADYPADLLRAYRLGALRWPILQVGRWLTRRFPADYLREMKAMYAAASVEYDRAVLTNTFYDVKKVGFCSALLVDTERSAEGGPLLGRNLDYPPLGYAHEHSLVTVYRPDAARHAFAAIGFPGMVGCLSGMNDAGLTVAVMEAYQVRLGHRRFRLSGMPFALCFRRLLEQCATIQEAYALLDGMKRIGLNSLVVADRREVAIFEISPNRVVVRGPQDGVCIGTNHFCTEELRPRVTLNLFKTLDHFAALQQWTQRRDQWSVSDLHETLHSLCEPDLTLQTMIFEPRKLRLHLAIGDVPASAGVLRVLDLEPLLLRSKVFPEDAPTCLRDGPVTNAEQGMFRQRGAATV